MADEEDIAVVIEPEADGEKTEQKRDEQVVVKQAEPVDDLAAQFEALKAQEARTQQAREAAEREASRLREDAARARHDANTARGEAIDSQFSTVESGLAAAQEAADAAEREYKTAFEAGDGAAAAAAQRKIARAEASIARLSEARADLEARKPKAERVERREEPRQTDPVEELIRGRSPKTADWLRAHPDWAAALATGNSKALKLTAAHNDALAEGITLDSPEYFEHVETFIGLKTEAKPNGHDKTNGQAKRRQAPPVAPGQASAGGTSGGNEVRLSAGEARAAQDGTHVWNYDDPSPQKRFKKGDAIGIQEFARRKREMQKQGLYDRTFVEQ